VPHHDGIEDRLLVEGELVLAEHRDPLTGGDGDLPLVALHLPRQDLQEGRFPRAVGADEPVAVARGELDVDVLEQDPLAVGKGDVCCTDQCFFSLFLA
jgi:hypothetical protein